MMNKLNSPSETIFGREDAKTNEALNDISNIIKVFISEEQKKIKKTSKSSKKKSSTLFCFDNILLVSGLIIYSFIFLILFPGGLIYSGKYFFDWELNELQTGIIWKTILILMSILLVLYVLYLVFSILNIRKNNKPQEIRIKAINEAFSYNENHEYKIIERLGIGFCKDYLHRAEIKLKASIRKENKISNKEKKYLQLASILLAVSAIIIFEISADGFINFLSAVVGIAAVLSIVIEVFHESLYQERIDVYEKCVLILQEAQEVAANEELNAIQAYDKAIASDNRAIPFEQAEAEIDTKTSESVFDKVWNNSEDAVYDNL